MASATGSVIHQCLVGRFGSCLPLAVFALGGFDGRGAVVVDDRAGGDLVDFGVTHHREPDHQGVGGVAQHAQFQSDCSWCQPRVPGGVCTVAMFDPGEVVDDAGRGWVPVGEGVLDSSAVVDGHPSSPVQWLVRALGEQMALTN